MNGYKKAIQDTSIESLREHARSGELGKQHRMIMLHLNNNPEGLSNNDINRQLILKISTVTARINELRKKGLVVRRKEDKVDPYTNRRVRVWVSVIHATNEELENIEAVTEGEDAYA